MKDLTEGSIPRHLLELSSFLAVSMLLQTLYFLVDLYFVSGLGGPAIAGVGLAGNLMMVILALTQMLGVGTTSLIAQAAGRRDRDDAQAIFEQSCLLSMLAGGVVLAGGILLRMPYCRWLSADEATVQAASQYMLWLIPSFALQFMLVSMGSALRATGVVKPGMFVQALTVGLNAVLAPVLIAGWGTGRPMGTAGAGLATLIAVAAGVLALTVYFVGTEKFVQVRFAGVRVHFGVWKRLLSIGLPAGGEFIMLAVYTVLVYWIIRERGAAAQAGFGIGVRLMQSLFLPVMAVSFGASPLAGQNFGARRFDRVRETFRVAALMAASIMAAMTVICHLSPDALVRFFAHEEAVIAHGAEYLRILSWGFVAYGLTAASSSMFQAIGNTWPALASSALRVTVFAISGVWVSRVHGFELRHLWYAAVSVGFLQCAVSYALLQREFGRRLR
jgi:putative MATE family efflux protein